MEMAVISVMISGDMLYMSVYLLKIKINMHCQLLLHNYYIT
jgi:hypothetical protein